MKKKMVAVFLTAVMAASTMMGCGQKAEGEPASGKMQPAQEADSEEAESGAGQGSAQAEAGDGFYVSEAEGGKTTDQFTIWVGKTSSAADDTITQQVMREELGIDYKCEFLQGDDAFTTVNLRLSSGDDLPDMMVFQRNAQVEKALIDADRVMKLNDIYSSDKLVNISGIDERIVKMMSQENGDIYTIPGWYDSNLDDPWPGWTQEAWWINTEYMEQAGVTEEDISTIEGMEEALRKFAQLKDESGKAIIPLSMCQTGYQKDIILSTFGVDTCDSSSGFPTMMEIDGKFVPVYENPNYKTAMAWMNHLYREGLIDIEAPTIQSERFKEKIKNGQVAAWVSDFWSGDPWNIDLDAESLDAIRLKYMPFQSPKVEGIEKAAAQAINPYPTTMVMINKDTKHLNAVLNFLEWCNEPNPYKQQEVNDGPEGINWFFTDDQRMEWAYTPEYEEARGTKITGTPELWWLANYGKEWYPWWNNKSADERYNDPAIPKIGEACQEIAATIVNHRVVENIDLVSLGADSQFASNRENLKAVVDEYEAKMFMAQTDEEFEDAYTTFMEQLELRANWSELKAEWENAYKNQFGGE